MVSGKRLFPHPPGVDVAELLTFLRKTRSTFQKGKLGTQVTLGKRCELQRGVVGGRVLAIFCDRLAPGSRCFFVGGALMILVVPPPKKLEGSNF